MPRMETPPELTAITRVFSRAWYDASIVEFLKTEPDTIVGRLVINSEFSLLPRRDQGQVLYFDISNFRRSHHA